MVLIPTHLSDKRQNLMRCALENSNVNYKVPRLYHFTTIRSKLWDKIIMGNSMENETICRKHTSDFTPHFENVNINKFKGIQHI